jgi:hypothetical protein
MSDVQFITEALDGLVAAGVWGQVLQREPKDDAVKLAQSIIQEELTKPHARNRFFGGFSSWNAFEERFTAFDPSPEQQLFVDNPVDPIDAGMRSGLNSFLRRAIFDRDHDLYTHLFGFVGIGRAERRSPLLLELSIVLSTVIAVPAAIVIGAAFAAASIRSLIAGARKAESEAAIRESEAAIRKEELAHKKLQSRILISIAAAAEQLGHKDIPKEAIVAAAKISATPVADLGSSPLIESLTIGVSGKAA